MNRKVNVANVTGKPVYVSVCDYGNELNVYISSKAADSNHADPVRLAPAKSTKFIPVPVKQEVESKPKQVTVKVAVPESLPSKDPYVLVDGRRVYMKLTTQAYGGQDWYEGVADIEA